MSVKPFRGLRYAAGVPELAQLVAPPYDVITPEQQQRFHSAHPHNVIRLILDPIQPTDTEENNRYTRSAATLRDWRRAGVLAQDARPAVYLYRHAYTHRGRFYMRYGLVARVKLAEPGQRRIVPHERTIDAPKADRLRLLQSTRANLCPIFLCYASAEGKGALLHRSIIDWCQATAPTSAVTLDGVEHAMWRIDDESRVALVGQVLEYAPLLIADGHHRYESACTYRDQQRQANGSRTGEEPWEYVMAYLTALDAEGMLILPIHRLVRGIEHHQAMAQLDQLFQAEPCADEEQLAAWLGTPDGLRFGVYGGQGRYVRLTPKPGVNLSELTEPSAPAPWRRLAVTILHQVVLKRWGVTEQSVAYTADAAEAMRSVDKGAADLAVFVQPTPVTEVRTIALSGERMPPKSTFFYPKLLTGLVINPLE